MKYGDAEIYLIQLCDCQSKMELERCERSHIESIECVNKTIPGRTKKEYYIDNKEKIKQYYIENKELICKQKKEYYIENKELICKQKKQHYIDHPEIKKQYYQKNKELICKKKREYYEDNKDKIK